MNTGAPRSIAQNTLPDWFPDQLKPLNTNFERRIVCLHSDATWLDTGVKGLQMRVLEFVPGHCNRLVAQLRFEHAHEPVVLGNHPDLEILVQAGRLVSWLGEHQRGCYIRLPDVPDDTHSTLAFQRADDLPAEESAIVYLAMGQMEQSDADWRSIDTNDDSLWFPGPVDGTDVLPLHGHGTGNIMLVRWNTTAAFKPRIDPRGEELLVVSGAVYDAQGFYAAGSWIRNPIVSWQAWGAKAGTVVYYKNGHFAR